MVMCLNVQFLGKIALQDWATVFIVYALITLNKMVLLL